MKLHHVAVQVADLERARAFWCGVLGLVELRRQAHALWLDLDGAIVMLETGADPARGGLHVVALAIGASERAAWREKLAAAGVAVESETAFTLYVRDPDGTRVGLSSYPDPAR